MPLATVRGRERRVKYKVFYSFQEDEDEQLDDEAQEMELSDAVKLVNRMTTDGDFFGLIDAAGTTLQVMYDGEEDVFWAEIPDPAKQGSHGALYQRGELPSVLGGLKPLFKAEDFPIFEFEEWDLDEDDWDEDDEDWDDDDVEAVDDDKEKK